MMTTCKTIKKSRPNGWRLSLAEHAGDGDTVYIVFGPEDEPDEGQEFVTLSEANAYYEEQVLILAKTPNWEAQAAYDEAYGTDNGYAPWQYNQER